MVLNDNLSTVLLQYLEAKQYHRRTSSHGMNSIQVRRGNVRKIMTKYKQKSSSYEGQNYHL